MTSDNVFGSHELTPNQLRTAQFEEVDGRVDAAEVRTYLDRVASSIEVFMSGDAPTALRAEFDRNAAIATQILDAGQTASEQLRRQAAEEAKRILDEARDATLGLRETVESEIAEARSQVEAMRGTFIQDLRDLYDRIGASLYRFERAAEAAEVAPIAEPARLAPSDDAMEFRSERGIHAAPQDGRDEVRPGPVTDSDLGPAPELPEGAKAPAWQQLPPEAYSPPPSNEALEAEVPDVTADVIDDVPGEAAADAPDPFAVVEDEPLAPGEPLVDLRTFGATVEDVAMSPEPSLEPSPMEAEAPANVTETGDSWLDPAPPPPVAPQAAAEAPTEPSTESSWLDTPLDPDPAADAPADPSLARDDALANALIGEVPAPADDAPQPGGDEQAAAPDIDVPAAPFGEAAPPPAGAASQPAGAAASADAIAVRQVILDALASGQTRESIESYLREHMGLLEPGALIDAALASGEQQ